MDARELVARRLVVGLGGTLPAATRVADLAETLARTAEADVGATRTLALLYQLGLLVESATTTPARGVHVLLSCLEGLTDLRQHLSGVSEEASIGELCATFERLRNQMPDAEALVELRAFARWDHILGRMVSVT